MITNSEYTQRVAELDAREAGLRNAQSAAAADRDRAAFKGASTTEIDAELAQYERDIADVLSARRGLAEAFATSTATARADSLKLHVDGAELFAQKHVAAGKALDKAITALRAALIEFTRTGHGAFGALAGAAPLAGIHVDQVLAVDPRKASLGTMQQALHDVLQADREAGGELHAAVELKRFTAVHGSSVEASAKQIAQRIADTTSAWRAAA